MSALVGDIAAEITQRPVSKIPQHCVAPELNLELGVVLPAARSRTSSARMSCSRVIQVEFL